MKHCPFGCELHVLFINNGGFGYLLNTHSAVSHLDRILTELLASSGFIAFYFFPGQY